MKSTKPIANYFKNVRRGPPGVLRKCLRADLPAWVVSGLSVVGSSILEVLIGRKLKDRLTTTMKIMGIAGVKNFNMLKAVKKQSPLHNGSKDTQGNH